MTHLIEKIQENWILAIQPNGSDYLECDLCKQNIYCSNERNFFPFGYISSIIIVAVTVLLMLALHQRCAALLYTACYYLDRKSVV